MDLAKLKDIAAQELFKHKLIGWTVALVDTGRRLGVCKFKGKHIGISEHFARHSPEENVLDTLFHEIAHALTPGHGHDTVWKAMAFKLGATPRACDAFPDSVPKPGDWQAKCSTCGMVYHRYKRPMQLSGYKCKYDRSPLTFAYVGDPALKPPEPTSIRYWQTKCPGCGTLHQRRRRLRQGMYRCKCPHHSQLPPWQQVHVPVSETIKRPDASAEIPQMTTLEGQKSRPVPDNEPDDLHH